MYSWTLEKGRGQMKEYKESTFYIAPFFFSTFNVQLYIYYVSYVV